MENFQMLIKCKNCNIELEEKKHFLHENFCFKNYKLCGLCNDVIEKSEYNNHVLLIHKGNDKEEKNDKIENKKEAFVALPFQCSFCELKFLFEEDAFNHEVMCSSRTEKCEVCNKNVILKYYHQHRLNCQLTINSIYKEKTQSENLLNKKDYITKVKSNKSILNPIKNYENKNKDIILENDLHKRLQIEYDYQYANELLNENHQIEKKLEDKTKELVNNFNKQNKENMLKIKKKEEDLIRQIEKENEKLKQSQEKRNSELITQLIKENKESSKKIEKLLLSDEELALKLMREEEEKYLYLNERFLKDEFTEDIKNINKETENSNQKENNIKNTSLIINNLTTKDKKEYKKGINITNNSNQTNKTTETKKINNVTINKSKDIEYNKIKPNSINPTKGIHSISKEQIFSANDKKSISNIIKPKELSIIKVKEQNLQNKYYSKKNK